MPQPPTDPRPHSAQFLTDARDLWWNEDYLHLIAARLGLARVRRALDVGSGLGHWTRTLARVLPAGVRITGVEREPAWVVGAQRGPPVPGATLTFIEGIADALPFPAASFDLVTCQTLLIHVADPQAVLAEMARVLVPGGQLLVAEPNNLAALVGLCAASPDFDIDDAVAAFRLEATCEKGKHRLGLGYNSLGEGLLGLLDDALWHDVHVWLNDRAPAVRPPYTAAMKIGLDDERRQYDAGAVGWPQDETRRYYDAGGGDAAAFDDLWMRARRVLAARFRGVDAGTYAAAVGSLHYVIAARRR
jgi:SAM-dependent methyltransferase